MCQKVEILKKNSDQELLSAALYEVSDEARFYDGNMLKKYKSDNRKRSKSVDVSANFRVVK